LKRRVAITGISGYLGFHLARALALDPDIEFILGLDLQPPPTSLPRLTFIRHDITAPFGSWFLEHWIDTAVHLAFYPPARDRARAREVNLSGTDQLLEACHRAGVLQVVLVSCASVYGRPAEMADAVTEDAPLRGDVSRYGDGEDKLEQEARCLAFERDHPEARLIRVRPVAVLGPGATHPVARALTRSPLVIPRRMGAIQVCHVEDAVRALHALVTSEARGAFNLGPDDAVHPDDLTRTLNRRPIRVPRRALHALARLGTARGWPIPAELAPEALASIERPSRVSSRRLQREFDFRFRYSSRRTLELFAGARGLRPG
jgi:UDP-glucose 4-epimerase